TAPRRGPGYSRRDGGGGAALTKYQGRAGRPPLEVLRVRRSVGLRRDLSTTSLKLSTAGGLRRAPLPVSAPSPRRPSPPPLPLAPSPSPPFPLSPSPPPGPRGSRAASAARSSARRAFA